VKADEKKEAIIEEMKVAMREMRDKVEEKERKVDEDRRGIETEKKGFKEEAVQLRSQLEEAEYYKKEQTLKIEKLNAYLKEKSEEADEVQK